MSEKAPLHHAPLFSIITVSRNAIGTIRRVVECLDAQTCRDFEWIVIDGASSDGTLDVLTENREKIQVLVSEPDNGIYDAMNKGVAAACGRWIFFLNADDHLADAQVLADVAAALSREPAKPAILFGNVVYTDGKRSWPRRFHWINPRTLLFGDLCHQAVFAMRESFVRHGAFDVTLKINADYEWLLRVFRAGERTLHLERDIAVFYKGGAHMRNPDLQRKERQAVRLRYCHPGAAIVGEVAVRMELRLRKWLGQTV